MLYKYLLDRPAYVRIVYILTSYVGQLRSCITCKKNLLTSLANEALLTQNTRSDEMHEAKEQFP